MKVAVNSAKDYENFEYREFDTFDELMFFVKEKKEDVIVAFIDPKHSYLREEHLIDKEVKVMITVYDGYLE